MASTNVLLTINEVAELESSSYQTIKKKIQRDSLRAIKITTNEKCGFEYRIDLNDLSEKARRKYYARLKATDETKNIIEDGCKEDKYTVNIEKLTDSQRQDIAYWKKVIKDWQDYISRPENYKRTSEATEEFINIHNIQNPKRAISSRTLRRKYKDYKEYGEIALADHRANRKDKGTNTIDDTIWSVFLQWWLDENQPTVSHVYRITCVFASIRMKELLPLPSEDTFRRAINNIPKIVIEYFRHGKKVFEDECLPYLVRQYDLIDSNDIWTADFHTLDMMVRDDISGKVYRPHVVVWMDIRSRKVLSLRLCESSNSDGVILAFRDAIKAYGIPKQAYLDNGREFLVHDFGGRGKRKSAENADYGSTILERLGIEMTNARVKNARAKVIERTFKQVCEEFAKLYITYCGNRPENRPERHNEIMKNKDNIPLVSEVKKELWTYFEGWYNMQGSEAEGLNGMSPNECYAEHLIVKRTATEEQLNLMLARSSNLQSVGRNCVYLKFGDRKIWFYNEEIVTKYFKEKVYVRYDSEDLSQVMVYDEKERLIGLAYRMEVGGYDSEKDKESIKKLNSKAKKIKNFVKEFMESNVDLIEAPEMREIMLEAARRNIEENRTSYEAKIVEPINFKRGEDDELEKVVGNTDSIVYMDRMIKNARKNKNMEE